MKYVEEIGIVKEDVLRKYPLFVRRGDTFNEVYEWINEDKAVQIGVVIAGVAYRKGENESLEKIGIVEYHKK